LLQWLKLPVAARCSAWDWALTTFCTTMVGGRNVHRPLMQIV
jgi:hypothetical protein